MQGRQKWNNKRPNLNVNDVVLIVNDHATRNEWRMGRVTKANPDKDGLVRKATVKSGDSEYERPVQKLVLLIENKTENPSRSQEEI